MHDSDFGSKISRVGARYIYLTVFTFCQIIVSENLVIVKMGSAAVDIQRLVRGKKNLTIYIMLSYTLTGFQWIKELYKERGKVCAVLSTFK